MMSFVVRRGEAYSARLVIPKKLRSILGKNEFKKSLGTSNRKEAELLAAPLVLQWKKLIEEASRDGVLAKAKALKRGFEKDEQEGEVDDFIKNEIIEREMEDVILGGKNFHEVDDERKKADAKTFFGIASGKIVTLEEYVDDWVVSIGHLKMKTVDQMKRDVTAFQKAETAHIPDGKFIASWIRRTSTSGVGPKTIKRKLGSLSSFWEFLLSQDIVNASSPFSGHKLPRTKSGQSLIRRAFNNNECLMLIEAALSGKDKPLADLIHLALYTGARIEELCSLKVEDVLVEENYRCLRVVHSKTVAGARQIPLHPAIAELVDVLVKNSKDGYLIPVNSNNKYGQRSPGLSKRFGRLRKEVGLGPDVVFHSLRKTVTTKLEQAGVPEGVSADIVGHEKQTITYGLYSGGTSMAQKMEAISKIEY